MKGWRDLGFVRLGDYSRECLGLAGRTLEEDARVARTLEHLPRITAAFLASTLSWTQVRILSAIARPRDEQRWIMAACNLDTRLLEALVRKRTGTKSSKLDASVPDDQNANLPNDDEESVRFSVRLSRDGQRLWRAACELAERSAGSALTQAQILELVVAEAASGLPRAAAEGDTTACAQPDDTQTEHSPSQQLAPDLEALLEHFLMNDEREPTLEQSPSSGVAPASLRHIEERPDVRDPFAVHARLREVTLAMQRIDAEVGCLLRLALERRLHRNSGFCQFADYVDARLDLCARKAWTLIAIDRAASRTCPELVAAYREGHISHLAAARLLPVIGSLHGPAWIERAGLVTLRRLEAEVAWALDRRDAAAGSASFECPAPPPLDHVLGDPLAGLDRERVQMRADSDAAPAGGRSVQLHLLVPAAVVELAEETLLALRRGLQSRGSAFERMVAMAMLEWMSAPAHRDPVFARDGWRCAVPGCRSRRNLHDHHVLFRSHGGDNAQGNRVTVCAAHHLHHLHAGRIRAHGRAPSAIVWEMPLARLLGDRYLKKAA